MEKITLSLHNTALKHQIKKYAKKRGISVSSLVENYLHNLIKMERRTTGREYGLPEELNILLDGIDVDIVPFVPAFSIDSVYYILNSSMKIEKQQARSAVLKLLKFTEPLHTTDASVNLAFSSDFPDFEDGMINALAESGNMDAIITNNIDDYSRSTLPVYRPLEFISLFH